MQIAFIDEDADQRETYCLMLKECFPEEAAAIDIVGYEPSALIGDMSFLVQNEDIVAIILDEQLKDSGIANYLGIDLAIFLRGLNRKIPIYILTSYPDSDELLSSEITVEDILSKQDLPNKKEIVGARILRRINTFYDLLTDREMQFENLLRKSVAGTLNEEEMKILSELGYLRSAAFEVEEIFSQEKLKRLNLIEEKINQIEAGLAQKI